MGGPDAGCDDRCRELPGAFDEELAAFGLASYVLDRTTVLREDINWKLVVDGFLESYHIRYLHGKTIGPYIRTNLAAFEPVGAHGRMVAVRATYVQQLMDVEPDNAAILPHIAIMYQLFPGTVLVWQGDHVETWAVFPEGDSPARCASRVSLLVPEDGDATVEHWDKNWKILLGTVLDEDFAIARTMQANFRVGAQSHLTFGRNEPALQHFHRQLEHLLGADPASHDSVSRAGCTGRAAPA